VQFQAEAFFLIGSTGDDFQPRRHETGTCIDIWLDAIAAEHDQPAAFGHKAGQSMRSALAQFPHIAKHDDFVVPQYLVAEICRRNTSHTESRIGFYFGLRLQGCAKVKQLLLGAGGIGPTIDEQN
jgi:hypothetical protein